MFARIDTAVTAIRQSLGFITIGFLVPFSAFAADMDTPGDAQSATPSPARFGRIGERLAEWQVVVGGGAMIAPEYEGSDEYKVMPVPFVSATLFDVLTVDTTGATLKVLERDAYKLSVRLGYELGRQEDDSDRLRGMGDVDFGATVGAKAAVELGPVELFAMVDKTIGGSEGLVGRVGLEATQPVSERLFLGASASAVFADENHMQAYFGVSAEQAARSGLARYDAGAGLKRADFSLSATYSINRNWVVRGEAQVGVLLGDAADSPVVVEKIQPSAMLLVGYKF